MFLLKTGVGHQNHFTDTMSDRDETQLPISFTVTKMITTSQEIVKGVAEAHSLERRLSIEVCFT